MKFKFDRHDVAVGLLLALCGICTTDQLIPAIVLFGVGMLISEAYRHLPPPRNEADYQVKTERVDV